MAYTYPKVSISGVDYNAYETLENADLYLAASLAAVAWLDADDDTKGKGLIGAVRWLESLTWKGEKTDAANALAFPRTGITVNGVAVDENSIPQGIIYGYYEIAGALLEDPTLFTSLSDPGIRSMAAGPVNVSFFRGGSTFWAGPVPKAALSYILPYLDSVTSAGGPTVSGVDAESAVGEDLGFNHGL